MIKSVHLRKNRQLDDIVVAKIRHPDICSVKSDSFGTCADRKRILKRAVAGPQFCHSAAADIRYPDICTVESDSGGSAADCKRSLKRSVAGAQLCHIVAALIHPPDIRTVKSNHTR